MINHILSAVIGIVVIALAWLWFDGYLALLLFLLWWAINLGVSARLEDKISKNDFLDNALKRKE